MKSLCFPSVTIVHGIRIHWEWQVRSYFWMERSKLPVVCAAKKKKGFPQNYSFWIKLKHKTLWYWKPWFWLHYSQDAEMLRLIWITEASLSTNFGWDLLHPSEKNPSSGISYAAVQAVLSVCRVAGNVWSEKDFRKLRWTDLLILKPT